VKTAKGGPKLIGSRFRTVVLDVVSKRNWTFVNHKRLVEVVRFGGVENAGN